MRFINNYKLAVAVIILKGLLTLLGDISSLTLTKYICFVPLCKKSFTSAQSFFLGPLHTSECVTFKLNGP